MLPRKGPRFEFSNSIRAARWFTGSHCLATSLPYPRNNSTRSSSTPPATNNANNRWLSDVKARLGRLFFHGTTPEEARESCKILKELTANWRTFAASSEGFLTSPEWRGLYRHSVVWGDMDSMAHVNNVVYVRWAESARVNWAQNLARYHDSAHAEEWSQLWTPKKNGMILRSIKVDYKFPITYPDRVSVYHKLGTTGEDSFTLDVIIFSEKHQRPAARCVEDIVLYNYKPDDPTQKPGKTKIPPYMKRLFDDTLQQQKEAKDDTLEKMRVIDERVAKLERTVLGRKEMK